MIKSMTGFGRAEEIISGRDIIVEIRSVITAILNFPPVFPELTATLRKNSRAT